MPEGDAIMAETKIQSTPIRPTDDEARALARRLVRSARYGALAVAEPGTGHPLASRVATATDMDGAPLVLVSTLAAHTGALLADPRCAILLGEPGKGDPLAHPRITVAARALKIERDGAAHARARRRYLGRHPKAELYVDFPDFAFFKLVPQRASLNGGFGKAYELGADDLVIAPERLAELADAEAGAVAHMNDDHADAIALYATRLCKATAKGTWSISALDPFGVDLVNGDHVERLEFDGFVADRQTMREELVRLAKLAREG
jgi:hypothetical protein